MVVGSPENIGKIVMPHQLPGADKIDDHLTRQVDGDSDITGLRVTRKTGGLECQARAGLKDDGARPHLQVITDDAQDNAGVDGVSEAVEQWITPLNTIRIIGQVKAAQAS